MASWAQNMGREILELPFVILMGSLLTSICGHLSRATRRLGVGWELLPGEGDCGGLVRADEARSVNLNDRYNGTDYTCTIARSRRHLLL